MVSEDVSYHAGGTTGFVGGIDFFIVGAIVGIVFLAEEGLPFVVAVVAVVLAATTTAGLAAGLAPFLYIKEGKKEKTGKGWWGGGVVGCVCGVCVGVGVCVCGGGGVKQKLKFLRSKKKLHLKFHILYLKITSYLRLKNVNSPTMTQFLTISFIAKKNNYRVPS